MTRRQGPACRRPGPSRPRRPAACQASPEGGTPPSQYCRTPSKTPPDQRVAEQANTRRILLRAAHRRFDVNGQLPADVLVEHQEDQPPDQQFIHEHARSRGVPRRACRRTRRRCLSEGNEDTIRFGRCAVTGRLAFPLQERLRPCEDKRLRLQQGAGCAPAASAPDVFFPKTGFWASSWSFFPSILG
jgi:hypothetical protein